MLRVGIGSLKIRMVIIQKTRRISSSLYFFKKKFFESRIQRTKKEIIILFDPYDYRYYYTRFVHFFCFILHFVFICPFFVFLCVLFGFWYNG